MTRFGDESEGFSIESNGSRVDIQTWGFWSAELSWKFHSASLDVLRGAEKGVQVRVNVENLRLLRDEGQEAFSNVFAWVIKHTAGELLILSAAPTTKLQMLRLARNLGPNAPISVQ